jgi:hypothetical protein
MLIYVSSAFLALAFLLAVFSRTLFPRICFGCSIFVWTAYLLYFQIEGLARVVARQPPQHPLSENPYVVGVIAYKDALIDLRLSILIVVLALVVLTLGLRGRRGT